MTARILFILVGMIISTINAELFGSNYNDNYLIKQCSQDTFQTIFFEVTSPENDHVSYLFGTHHAFGESFFDSLYIAKRKLLESDILIKENLNIPGHLMEDIINKRNKITKWSKYLDKKDYRYVEEIFSNSEVDLHKVTPTELNVILSRVYRIKVCKSKTSTDPHDSLDDSIAGIAKKNNLEVIGLETTEEQLELIRKDVAGMPRKVHKKRLARLIERMRSGNTNHCPEIETYIKMDYDYKLDQPCQNKLILTDRNNNWMPVIENHLKTNNCFIAVGLSHLMFDCGLITQLKERGFKVTPIPVK